MIFRYWRTIRHLKLEQIYGRALFRLNRPKPDLRPPPPRRSIVGTWVQPAQPSPSLIGKGNFHLLNESGDLERIGWNGPERSKLWRYNQHYFEDLIAQDAVERRDWHEALILSWLAENPPGHGDGWAPYPIAARMVNWIKWLLAGNELPTEAIQSLAVQARWLSARLERHLGGNHLFTNAKGLIFAGFFFEGPESCAWREKGFALLDREFREQVLPDGGHFELSPMYHAITVVDLLDLVNLMDTFGGATSASEGQLLSEWRGRLPSMLRWLEAMTHPDGELSFFNDSAFGIAPRLIEIAGYAQRLSIETGHRFGSITWLKDSGYIRLSSGPSIVLADVAAVGPDYLPGHAHADTLSFELSLHRRRIIVNSGTSEYAGPERLRQRGTPAHSTVTVDGCDSSEVWSSFRVGRRARVRRVQVQSQVSTLVAEGEHNGYRYLLGSPVHRRTWQLKESGLLVRDSLEGAGRHNVEALFHLAPGLRAGLCTDKRIVVQSEDGSNVCTLSIEGGAAEIEASSWHPEFGQTIVTQKIRVHATADLPTELKTEIMWG